MVILSFQNFGDAIRMILVHRYGGWYSDLDMVFLRPLVSKGGEPLHNVAACDSVDYHLYDDPASKFNFGIGISNAIFHNDAGHIFLKTAIQLFASVFQNGVWSSSGPKVLSKALEVICGYKKINTLNPKEHSRKHCSGMAVIEPRSFYAVNWFFAGVLFDKRQEDYWAALFNKSYVVHFYGSSSRTIHKRVLRPNQYGRDKPAYAFLGPDHCPVSFYSARPF